MTQIILPLPKQVATETGIDTTADWGEVMVTKLPEDMQKVPGHVAVRFRGLIDGRFVENVDGDAMSDLEDEDVLQWVGPVVTDPGQWAIEPGWPCIRPGFLTHHGLALQAWHRAVWTIGRPAYAQLRWKPETGDRFSIVELSPTYTDSARNALRRRSRALLAAVEAKGGRPPGEKFWPREVFRPVFVQTWKDLKARLRRRPSDIEVWAEMPRHEGKQLKLGTFRRRWRSCFPSKTWGELGF